MKHLVWAFLIAGLLVSQPCFSETSSVRPIILVPGWGYDYSALIFRKDVFDPYVRWLTRAGFPAKDIHVVDYSYLSDLDTIGGELTEQLKAIVASYPEGTQFDIMGHSLGGFAALYGIMVSGLSSHFKKFISLAGIPQGWNAPYCANGLCGEAHKDPIPYHSPFVMNFLNTYEKEIRSLEKCSLYSPADEFVRPYNAGKFTDGINVEVPHLRHMQVIWTKRGFDLMRLNCYSGTFR